MLLNLLRICIVIAFPVACVVWTAHLAGDGAELIKGKPFKALCMLQELSRGHGAETNCLATDWLWLFRTVAWAALAIANQDAPESGELCLRCHKLQSGAVAEW